MFEDLSYEPFKEPRGFLKILQWVFAICAFATTCNFSSTSSVDLVCNNVNVTVPKQHLAHTFEYTFDLDQPKNAMLVNACKNESLPAKSHELSCTLVGNARSDSEFFVTTGVFAFLYSTALILIFLLQDKMYTANGRAPLIDFCITLIFALFWLAGSSAWSNGLKSVRAGADPHNWQIVVNGTDPKGVLAEFAVEICSSTNITGFTCESPVIGEFGGIVISILFGFINFILWAGNLWFLYKETSWFENVNTSTVPGTSAHA